MEVTFIVASVSHGNAIKTVQLCAQLATACFFCRRAGVGENWASIVGEASGSSIENQLTKGSSS